jgi:predicted peptidase
LEVSIVRTVKWTFLIFVLGLFFWGENAVMGASQSAETLNKQIVKPLTCEYLLSLPKGYGEKDQQWPLMLFLHGAGERGSDLNLVKQHGPPKLIEQGKDLPFIVVSPQCPTGLWWPELLDTLNALLDEIESKYDVDPSRVYLTGLSMGGFGSWSLACDQPERFAAGASGSWETGSRMSPSGLFMGRRIPWCRLICRRRWFRRSSGPAAMPS